METAFRRRPDSINSASFFPFLVFAESARYLPDASEWFACKIGCAPMSPCTAFRSYPWKSVGTFARCARRTGPGSRFRTTSRSTSRSTRVAFSDAECYPWCSTEFFSCTVWSCSERRAPAKRSQSIQTLVGTEAARWAAGMTIGSGVNPWRRAGSPSSELGLS